jgi:hypothetical protein
MELHKLRVKVGPHEFEAEGTEDSVESLFNAWKALIEAPNRANETAPKPPRNPLEDPNLTPLIDSATGNALFTLDSGRQVVSLRVHPTGDSRNADALLLLVFGHRMVGMDEVPVTKLKEAMALSGLRVERVDRAIDPHVRAGLLLKAGSGKGGKYRLSNTGLARVQVLQHDLEERMA